MVVTATLAPVRQNRRPKERRIDGFPLSYYPMFGKRRWATAVMAQLPEHTELAHLVRVEIVLGEFDLDACMLARRADGNETVLAFAELGTTSRLPASPSSEVITRAWA